MSSCLDINISSTISTTNIFLKTIIKEIKIDYKQNKNN